MSNGRKCVGGKRKALLHQVAVPRGLCSMCGSRFLCRLLFISIPAVKYDLKRALSVCFLFIYFFARPPACTAHFYFVGVKLLRES